MIRANIIESWTNIIENVSTYIVHSALLVLAMGKRAGVTKTASLSLLPMATDGSFVLDVGHLVLIV